MAGAIDMLPTLCNLAGVRIPQDRTIDGRDIFPLMTSETAKSPHEALYSMSAADLVTVRSGKWKLHVRKPAPGFQYLDEVAAAKWVDPRGPDGVTLIGQPEQPRPNRYPGVRTGDEAKEMMLFDLDADRAEQHDVAKEHPDVVARLKKLFDGMNEQAPRIDRPERHGSGGVMRLQGGALRYDVLPKPPEQ